MSPPVGGRQRFDHLVNVDIVQDAIEHHRRDRDDRDAQHEADAVQANSAVTDVRSGTQQPERAWLTIG